MPGGAGWRRGRQTRSCQSSLFYRNQQRRWRWRKGRCASHQRLTGFLSLCWQVCAVPAYCPHRVTVCRAAPAVAALPLSLTTRKVEREVKVRHGANAGVHGQQRVLQLQQPGAVEGHEVGAVVALKQGAMHNGGTGDRQARGKGKVGVQGDRPSETTAPLHGPGGASAARRLGAATMTPEAMRKL